MTEHHPEVRDMKPRTITVGGICSGMGGFALGCQQAGMEVRWEVEIDKSCRKLLAERFPEAEIHDDMITFAPTEAHKVNVLTGGTPCQGFSVAGLRKSLSDDRSNLALRFLHIADALEPDAVLWENVPGVLNTKDNAFGCFLAGLVGADAPLVPPKECGGRWTDAGMVTGPKRTAGWRVLDSQYFGVAQRRRRVFVVASPRADLPFQVLFEPEGLRRDTPPSRQTGQGAARSPAAGAGGGRIPDLAGTFGGGSQSGGFRTTDLDNSEAFIPVIMSSGQANAEINTTGLAPTVNCLHEAPIVTIPIQNATRGKDQNGLGIGQNGDPQYTLDQGSQHAVAIGGDITHTLTGEGHDASEDGSGRGTPVVAFRTNAAGQRDPQGDISAAVTTMTDPSAQFVAFAQNTRDEVRLQGGDGQIIGALAAEPGMKQTTYVAFKPSPSVAFERRMVRTTGGQPQEELNHCLRSDTNTGDGAPCVLTPAMSVRRLTPRETERLQGFPDDWSGQFADSTRYKMCGNAVTVNVILWLAKRIKAALE